jgi:hypothetical protein
MAAVPVGGVKLSETAVSLSAVPTTLVGGPGNVVIDVGEDAADVLVAFVAVNVNE